MENINKIPSNEKEFSPEYAETFARTTRTIDSDWACRPFVYQEVANLVESSEGKVGGLIADIGGGEGKVARDLRDMGITDPIILIDIDKGMLNKAKQEEKAHPRGIAIREGDAFHMPLADHSVKLGIRVLVDGHWTSPQLDQGNRELARVLVSNGTAIVAIPDPYGYIEQITNGRKTPGVVVANEQLTYADDQEVVLTLKNTAGKSVPIAAKMHTIERYRKSFEQAGLRISKELAPTLGGEEMHSYREAWGEEAIPSKYRLFVLKPQMDVAQ